MKRLIIFLQIILLLTMSNLVLSSCNPVPEITSISNEEFVLQKDKTVNLERSKTIGGLVFPRGIAVDGDELFIGHFCDFCGCKGATRPGIPGAIEKFDLKEKKSVSYLFMEDEYDIEPINYNAMVGQHENEIYMIKLSSQSEKQAFFFVYTKDSLEIERKIALSDHFYKPVGFYYPAFYFLTQDKVLTMLDIETGSVTELAFPIPLDGDVLLLKHAAVEWFIIFQASNQYYTAMFNEVSMQFNILGKLPDMRPYKPVLTLKAGDFISILWEKREQRRRERFVRVSHVVSFYNIATHTLHSDFDLVSPDTYWNIYPPFTFTILKTGKDYIDFGFFEMSLPFFYVKRFTF